MAKFKKGKSGNPKGKPKGARNKTTIAAAALLDGDAEAITKKAIEKAKKGDMAAIRLCLERILPAVKSRPLEIELPTVKTAEDVIAAQATAIAAMAKGELTPDEAAAITSVLAALTKTFEATAIEGRIRELEKRIANRDG